LGYACNDWVLHLHVGLQQPASTTSFATSAIPSAVHMLLLCCTAESKAGFLLSCFLV
jgi:hypothetical protein